jgi:pimeloyl-ACP methyl ester carboxylesterase
MPKTLLNGIEITYDDVGSGTAIVCIHGHPFNRSMWNPQVEALRDSYRVVTFDLRGYGESQGDDTPIAFEVFAQDTLALMDVLEIKAAAVMGLSMGGQIAFETWFQAPERVLALILADSSAHLDTPEGKQVRNDTADRLLKEGMGPYAEEVLSKMVGPSTISTKPDIAAHVMGMMQTTRPSGAASALRARSERRDYVPLLGGITVPTCIFVGRDDEFTPVSIAESMHEQIPGSQLVVIEAAGHMPNLEQPEAFNRALLNFLKGAAV